MISFPSKREKKAASVRKKDLAKCVFGLQIGLQKNKTCIILFKRYGQKDF